MRKLLLTAAFCFTAIAAQAAETMPYQPAAFAAAQAQNQPVLIAIHASWCPTCAKQEPIIAKLEADPAFKDVVVMRVDFDSQKDVVRQFGATMQSTLVAFHGNKETGRAVGVTDEAAIRGLMAKTQG